MKTINVIKCLILLQILYFVSGLNYSTLAKQQSITANGNVYKHVTGGGAAGTNFVTVDNLTDFDKYTRGDTVLLIQMKGVQIIVPESPLYGSAQNYCGSPGKYEFLVVEATESTTRTIWFRNNLINNYNPVADVQLIKVPSYGSADVNATITCQPWDSTKKTGGVLTMIVRNTLTLNADIDVSGKGFAGGALSSGAGLCAEPDINLQKYVYDTGYYNSGFKGEGIASCVWMDVSTRMPLFPSYVKGQGANYTGGGGGNGRFSGGGGGSNYGAGGVGGYESDDICSTPLNGGIGGRPIISTALEGGIFMGSGGGGSTYLLPDGIATGGGRGGGIIIILCDSIIGNGFSISADGESPSLEASGLAGAGGGGAGGTVALYLNGFSTSSNLRLSAEGAQGGNNSNKYGEGGGGGGGLLLISNITIPANVATSVKRGPRGKNKGIPTANNGANGEIITTFFPVLNGLFFNSIWSSNSLDLLDTIAIGQDIPRLIGSQPSIDMIPVTYIWEKSYNQTNWFLLYSGPDSSNYTSTIQETSTVYFRRTVIDSEGTVDVSEILKIEVVVITGVEKIITPGKMTISPNPVSDRCEIRLDDQNYGEVEILIFSSGGSKVSSSYSVKEGEQFRYTVPVEELSSGLYFIRLNINRSISYTGKILVL